MPDDSDNNIILWRLRVLEEAVRSQAGRIDTVKEQQDQLHADVEIVKREYVSRDEMTKTNVTQDANRATTRREVWTLRLMAVGITTSTVLGFYQAFHHH